MIRKMHECFQWNFSPLKAPIGWSNAVPVTISRYNCQMAENFPLCVRDGERNWFLQKIVFLKTISWKSRTPPWQLRKKLWQKVDKFSSFPEVFQQIQFLSLKNLPTQKVLRTISLQFWQHCREFSDEKPKYCSQSPKLMKTLYNIFPNKSLHKVPINLQNAVLTNLSGNFCQEAETLRSISRNDRKKEFFQKI